MFVIRRYTDKDYLNFIVVKNPNINYWMKSNGHVVLEIWHMGLFDKIAQKFFNSPKSSNIEMDKYGSFVWNNINSKRTLGEISQLVKKEFGDKAEPLEPRLLTFCRTLKSNDYIGFMLKENHKK